MVLSNRRAQFDIDEMVKHFSAHLNKLPKILLNLLFGQDKHNIDARINYLISEDVPEEIAKRIALTRPLYSSLNIIDAATRTDVEVTDVAKVYFKLMERLELIWFREKINDYPVENHWAVLARADYKGDLESLQRALTLSVLLFRSKSKKIEDRVDEWFDANKQNIARWKAVLGELRGSNINEFAMLTVAMRELLELAQASQHEDSKEKILIPFV